MIARANIFSDDCDCRDSDEVLLMRMRVFSDPESAPFQRYAYLILSIIKSKLAGLIEDLSAGRGFDDDELFDVTLWLKEVADIDMTNYELGELFKAAIYQRVFEMGQKAQNRHLPHQDDFAKKLKSNEKKARPKTYNKRPKLAALA